MSPSFPAPQPVPSTHRSRLHIPNRTVRLFTKVKSPCSARAARAFIAVMAVFTVTLLGVVAIPARQAQATPPPPPTVENLNLATVNTDGSKWHDVHMLMENGDRARTPRNDIVAVQESGGLPRGVVPTFETRTDRPDGAFQASEWHWYGYYIYYLPVPNANQNKQSMAIVTRTRADDFTVMPNNPGEGYRGSVGVRFGGTWYYSIHANPASTERARRDADGFVRQAHNRETQSVPDWFVMGDFNVDLQENTYHPPYGQVYRSHGPTHQSRAEYDFGVSNRYMPGYDGTQPEWGGSSDHIFPVEFRRNLVVTGRPGSPGYVQLRDERDNRNVDVLDARNGQPAVLNPVYRPDVHQDFQPRNIEQYPGDVMFENGFNHMCLGLAASPNSNSEGSTHSSDALIERVVSEPCDPNNPTQHFVAYRDHPDEYFAYNGKHILATTGAILAQLIASYYGSYLPLKQL